ncbi:MAG: Imm49 family immunity protein [Gammaproteobacteria bacterium]
MSGTIPQHPIRNIDFWQSHLQNLYAIMQGMSGQPTQDLRLRADLEREAGLVQRFLGQNGDDNLVAACEYGAALALMRTLQKRSEAFRVEIRQEEQSILLSGDRPLDFGWPNWLDTYALAVLLNHEDALSILSTADCIDACALPPENVDRFWPFLCSAFVTLAVDDPIAADLVRDAEVFMQETAVMDQAYVDSCYSPLLKVMHAILDHNQRGFTIAIKQAMHAFHGYYADIEDGDAEIAGLYHLPLSALVEQGRRAGLRLTIESDAILGVAPEPLTFHPVVAKYPLLAITDALEAEWFMALEGYQHHSNSNIYQEDEKLFASYFAEKAPGIPRAEFQFQLLREGETHDREMNPQPALDVGQLVHIAEVLASEPVTAPGGEQAYRLEEAVSAVDLALKYIHRMGGELDAGTLHSHIGKSLHDREPGRFHPERLLIYRNALASQAGLPETSPDAFTVAQSGEAATIQEKVFALIEALKPSLLPVLQAIAVDRTGEVVASLAPQADDYAKVFDGELVEIAKQHYAEWWKKQDLHIAIDENTRIDAHMAPAGMLGDENALSYYFPKGYRTIAPYLNPHRVWVCWKYHPEGESAGYSLNGLVWVEDHWAWFPKPYKLADLVAARGMAD